MSAPGLTQIWSLGIASTGEEPRLPNYDVWVVNNILFNRVITNTLASQLNEMPHSETRLRDEGIISFYSFLRSLAETLKSSARERGVAFPTFPDTPADWNEEVSTDRKALDAQFRPHMAEAMRANMDWHFGLRAKDPKPHWASEAAANWVSLDLFLQVMLAMGEVLGGSSEWGPFIAQMTSDELKGIVGVMGEEILRIRAQPGPGWDEEEAKRLTEMQLENTMRVMTIGT